MTFSLLPDVILNGVTDITVSQLNRRNIRLLMLDFDNTILPYTASVPTEAIVRWLRDVQDAGSGLCVISNSKKERVKVFCQKYGLDCVTHARKPSPREIRNCLKSYAIAAENAAMAGDQIYTDTLAGNLAGVTTILVSAIHNHTIWLKLRHVLEMPFIFLARNRRGFI